MTLELQKACAIFCNQLYFINDSKLDFVPENDRFIFKAKRMMKYLAEKTLHLDPKHKSTGPPKLKKLPRFSHFQDNIRQMTRLRVANALRTRMAKNQNILTWNKKDQS